MDIIQLKRGKLSDWQAENPVLEAGEAGIVFNSDTLVPYGLKVGNGFLNFNDLPFITVSGGDTYTREQIDEKFAGVTGQIEIISTDITIILSKMSALASSENKLLSKSEIENLISQSGLAPTPEQLSAMNSGITSQILQQLLNETAAIPTKTSDLTNDSDFATNSEVATVQADLDSHKENTSNPHNVTKAQLGLDKVVNVLQYSEDNPPPYPVTSVAGKTGVVSLSKSDVGLGNVDNTSDADKPVSTAVQHALDGKQNTIDSEHKLNADLVESGETNKVFTASEQSKLEGIEDGAQVNTVHSVNGQQGDVILDADNIDDSSTEHKFVTVTEKVQIAANATEIEKIKDGRTVVAKSELAQQLENVSEDSGSTQTKPFTFQATGTDSNTTSTPTAPIAKHLELRGNTVVWNQLVDEYSGSITTVNGHKYLTRINGTIAIVTGDGEDIAVTGGTDNVFDLTVMGIADAITSAVDFLRLFPNPYYPYNAGEVMSCTANKLITVGFNALSLNRTQGTLTYGYAEQRDWDYSKYYIGYAASNYYVPERVSNFSLSGTTISLTSLVGGYGVAFPIRVIGGQTYTFKSEVLTENEPLLSAVAYFDVSGKFISYKELYDGGTLEPQLSVTVPDNCYTAVYVLKTTLNVFTTFTNPLIYLTWDGTRTEYEPYVKHEYQLPQVTLRKAGEIFDTYTSYGVHTIKVGIIEHYSGAIGDTLQIPDMALGSQNIISNAGDLEFWGESSGDIVTLTSSLDDTTILYELKECEVVEGQTFTGNAIVDDCGTMEFWVEQVHAIPIPIIPQGNKFFYPADYSLLIDDLNNHVNGDAYSILTKDNTKKIDYNYQSEMLAGIKIGGVNYKLIPYKIINDQNGNEGLAIGSMAVPLARSVNIGYNAQSGSGNAVTIGTSARSSGSGVAIGREAICTGGYETYQVAIGAIARNRVNNSVSFDAQIGGRTLQLYDTSKIFFRNADVGSGSNLTDFSSYTNGHTLKDYLDEKITQYTALPTASSSDEGTIVQYVGATDSNYTNGYFYKCVDSSGDYNWEQINVQPIGTTVSVTPQNTNDIGSISINGTTYNNLPFKNSAQFHVGTNKITSAGNSYPTSVGFGNINEAETTGRYAISLGYNVINKIANSVCFDGRQHAVWGGEAINHTIQLKGLENIFFRNADVDPSKTSFSDYRTSGGKSLQDYLDAKQDIIDSSHELSADLIADSSTDHKFVTDADKLNWNGKQDAYDSSLETTDKTIVGAINDLNTTVNGFATKITTQEIEIENFFHATNKYIDMGSSNDIDTRSRTARNIIAGRQNIFSVNYNSSDDAYEIDSSYDKQHNFINGMHNGIYGQSGNTMLSYRCIIDRRKPTGTTSDMHQPDIGLNVVYGMDNTLTDCARMLVGGRDNIVTLGENAFVFGWECKLIGTCSNYTIFGTKGSVVFGYQSNVQSVWTLTQGYKNIIGTTADCSVTFGGRNEVQNGHQYAMLFGNGLKSANAFHTSVGRFNDYQNEPGGTTVAFSVGTGTDPEQGGTRRTSFKVTYDDKVKISAHKDAAYSDGAEQIVAKTYDADQVPPFKLWTNNAHLFYIMAELAGPTTLTNDVTLNNGSWGILVNSNDVEKTFWFFSHNPASYGSFQIPARTAIGYKASVTSGGMGYVFYFPDGTTRTYSYSSGTPTLVHNSSIKYKAI